MYRNSFCVTQQITVTTCHANTWKTWNWLFSTQVMRIWKLPGPLQPSKSWAVAVAACFMSSQSSQPLILPGSRRAALCATSSPLAGRRQRIVCVPRKPSACRGAVFVTRTGRLHFSSVFFMHGQLSCLY